MRGGSYRISNRTPGTLSELRGPHASTVTMGICALLRSGVDMRICTTVRCGYGVCTTARCRYGDMYYCKVCALISTNISATPNPTVAAQRGADLSYAIFSSLRIFLSIQYFRIFELFQCIIGILYVNTKGMRQFVVYNIRHATFIELYLFTYKCI